MEKLTEYLDAERGRRGALARSLGVSPSAISMWRQVPAERIGEVSRITGIRPEELRPDIFGMAKPSPQDGAVPPGASAPAGPGEPDLQPGPAFSSDVLAADGLRTGRAATPDGPPATCAEGETNVQEAAE